MKHLHLLTALILAVTMLASPAFAVGRQPEAEPFDLAMVPLPVEALPEPGYQVLTGGFLDEQLTAHWIASPRDGELNAASGMLDDSGWRSSYTLDLVLLQDRAYADSSILSLVQTNVYLFAASEGAEQSMATLADFSAASAAEPMMPVIHEAQSVRLTSESGDTLRSVVQQDRVVIEIVTLDTARRVDTDTHRRIVADSVDRLNALQHGAAESIAPRAVLIEDDGRVADIFNAQQTGVHQVYRVRDGAVQPAAGELDVPTAEGIAPGLVELYQIGQAVSASGGNGYYSSWIGEFSSIEDAALFISALDSAVDTRQSGALLPDPYFTAWSDEAVSRQGVAGVYRVSGTSANGAFSGTLEIRQQGRYVVGIGWRTWGNVLPDVDVTSRLMDAQLECLDSAAPCVPVALSGLMPAMDPGGATPVAPSENTEGQIGSKRYGWSLTYDVAEWTVTGQFADGDYEYYELRAGRSLVTIESVVDQRGDPQQCVLDEMHMLQEFEEHAVIDLGSDDPNESPAGLDGNHGWAIYTVEPLAEERADQEYTIRIDCYTLIDGAASLVVTQRAPRDLWASERDRGALLRDGLQFSERANLVVLSCYAGNTARTGHEV